MDTQNVPNEEIKKEGIDKSCEKCSWWYHERCLKNMTGPDGCKCFTTYPHVCYNCLCFFESYGTNRRNDKWFGFCYGFGRETPIRENPCKHSCKAWCGRNYEKRSSK